MICLEKTSLFGLDWVSYLFQREWFRRLWTFQEVALAKEVLFVCGRETVEWDPFASAAEDLYRLGLIRM
jgi:hypothetical protein